MFSVLGINFHVYGLLIGLGVVLAVRYSFLLGKRRGVDEKILNELAWWVVLAGIFGARAYHVIDLWEEVYQFKPLTSIYLWQGGKKK